MLYQMHHNPESLPVVNKGSAAVLIKLGANPKGIRYDEICRCLVLLHQGSEREPRRLVRRPAPLRSD